MKDKNERGERREGKSRAERGVRGMRREKERFGERMMNRGGNRQKWGCKKEEREESK